MSSFLESEAFLKKQRQIIHNERLQKEIDRSLTLLKKHGAIKKKNEGFQYESK